MIEPTADSVNKKSKTVAARLNSTWMRTHYHINITSRHDTLEESVQTLVIEPTADSVNKKSKTKAATD